jgi:hypothetical protein
MPQARWGYKNQQASWSAPDVTPQTYPAGWQQQSKWRRRYTQQQSTPVPPVVVTILTAQVTVTALPVAPLPGGVGWQQQSKWRRRYQQTPVSYTQPSVVVSLTTAQVIIDAQPITVVMGSPPWQQQSKWRRRYQQTPVSYAQPVASAPITVNLTTAQVTVNALAPTLAIGLPGAFPQHRWGRVGPQTPQPPVTFPVAVNLTTAQINVNAPTPTVIIPFFPAGWRQQSKWRRKFTQRAIRRDKPLTAGGKGADGLIQITYSDPATWIMSHSLAVAAQTDSFGNQVASGFQGAISVQKPGSSPSVIETWHQPSLLTGAASGNGVNGFFYRLTSENEVEVMWDLTFTGTGSGLVFFIMPLAYQPLVSQNLESGWYGTGPNLYNPSFNPYFAVLGNSGAPKGRCSIQTIPNALTVSVFGRQKFSLDK